MPGRNQKGVTIQISTWDRVSLEYESNLDYWASRGVNSTTALLEHYVLEGVSARRDEVRAIRDDLRELKEIVKMKLEDP